VSASASTVERVPHEAQRLDAVRRYDVLDTPPDGAFDRITHVAARICDAPISTITIVDEDRIWFKSTHGIEVDEIGRDPGLCASAIIQPNAYIVTDATIDSRTLDNPLVRGELGLRFYTGIPLTTSDGYRLGTLNVIDTRPRELDTLHLDSLRDLAAIVMDELELRLAAKSTVAAEAVREATRFRDAIIAGVSHEMRTPLAVLKGVVGLETGTESLTPEESEETRSMMRRQVTHLDWLVHRFLDYASLEGDRLPRVNAASVDPAALVRHASSVLPDDRRVIVDVQGDIPPAFADAERTQQIITELINNALRFGEGRPVDVAVRGGPGDAVRISVTDHGRGVHPDNRGRLFDKAYRGHNSTGTGLGLYLSAILAEAQGGRIEVDSTVGDGSTFTLVLPAADDHT
jgi:signal transduction histidine kinase